MLLFLFNVVFASSVSHRPGLSITPGDIINNYIISFNQIERKIATLLAECYVSIFWGVAITSVFGLWNSLRILAISHDSLALGISRIQILKKK